MPRRTLPDISVELAYKGLMALMTYKEIDAFAKSIPTDQFDRLIDWKAGSIAVMKHYKLDTITRGAHMQRQFTIELRVDFADSEKLKALKQTLLECARHAHATAMLISDNPKTTNIAIYSDDFFSGTETIGLMDDIIQQGLDKVGAPTASDEISAELAGAFISGNK